MYTGEEARKIWLYGDVYNLDLFRLEPSDDIEGCYVLRPEGITSAKVIAAIVSLLIAAFFLLIGFAAVSS